jgi:hypothetical protein
MNLGAAACAGRLISPDVIQPLCTLFGCMAWALGADQDALGKRQGPANANGTSLTATHNLSPSM